MDNGTVIFHISYIYLLSLIILVDDYFIIARVFTLSNKMEALSVSA
jgi:hypothetical protein